MTFQELGISEHIIKALTDHQISIPTDIQKQAIPQILEKSNDLVAVAQTGTGKTAAFCLPLLQLLDPQSTSIQALVLVPTRELGQQVAREFFLFSKYIPRVYTEAVYGGAPIEDQIQRLKRPTHVVVATPGRLIDLIERKALHLDNLTHLVLDEADEMISMGFKEEIDEILKSCDPNITKLLFTATMPKEVKSLIENYLKPEYAEIRINKEELVNQKIDHQLLMYEKGRKLDYLKSFLNERLDQRGILFCRTKIAAKRVAKQLAGFSVKAEAIHGNLNQEAREKVLRGFKKGRINLLVATDIAARGIDVKDLDFVIHYSLPENPEQYTHRSGRTARAGKSGVSLSFVSPERLPEIKKLEAQLNIDFSPMTLPKVIHEENLPLVEVFMNMGVAQGFDKERLTEFLVEEAGINKTDIGRVDVGENRSHFEVPENLFNQIHLNIKGMKVSHRNLKLTLDQKSSRNDR